MSLKDCIENGRRAGIFTDEEALDLKKRYDELARYILAPEAVRARLVAEKGAEAREQRRRDLLAQVKRDGLINTVMSYRDALGRLAPHKALWMLIEHFGYLGSQLDLKHKKAVIVRRAQEDLDAALWEFRKGWVKGEYRRKGPEQTARLDNIVHELFGEDTGDLKAKQFAQAWSRIAEKLRVRFNDAGGAIASLVRWGLPQHHSAEKLLGAGGHAAGSPQAKQAWINFVTPLLDRDRMVSAITGIKMTDGDLAEALSHVYDTIVTEGWSKREPSMRAKGKGATFSQHQDHRFLTFKDGRSWLQYQKAFGEGDVWGTMVSHINTMARDIAAMEVLGPNPEAMLQLLRDTVIKAQGHTGPVSRALAKQDAMWAAYSGAMNIPVSDRAADLVAAGRHAISSSSLGSAAISALSDNATDFVTRAFNGLPILRTFTGWLQEMGEGSQRHAARNGVTLSSAMEHGFEEAREYWSTSAARTISGFINERVLAASGLLAMTEMRKRAFGLDFQAATADFAKHSWDDLARQGFKGGAFRRNLERHGFDAASWDAIRAVPTEQPHLGAGMVAPAGPDGTGYLRPQEIEQHAVLPPEAATWDDAKKAEWRRDLAERYHAMILREMSYGIVESTLGARAGTVGAAQPGTFAGELLRSAYQFKGFGVSFMALHGERTFRELVGQNPAHGAAYGGALLITATLFGALAMQLKEIANGRDPRRMDLTDGKGRKFWIAAMVQGGGLGIYGDFLFSDVNRAGNGLAATVAGPMVDKLDNMRKLVMGNLIEFAEGKDKTNFGRELSYFLRTNMPGSSLWYAREAWNRVLMDQVQYLLDPDAHKSFRQQTQRRRTDYGQQYWWQPGQSSYDRSPDFSAMFP